MNYFDVDDEVTLQGVEEMPDPLDWGMTQEEYDELLEAQEMGDTFVVIGKETDGYYDIKNTFTGRTFNAISAYNLDLA